MSAKKIDQFEIRSSRSSYIDSGSNWVLKHCNVITTYWQGSITHCSMNKNHENKRSNRIKPKRTKPCNNNMATT